MRVPAAAREEKLIKNGNRERKVWQERDASEYPCMAPDGRPCIGGGPRGGGGNLSVVSGQFNYVCLCPFVMVQGLPLSLRAPALSTPSSAKPALLHTYVHILPASVASVSLGTLELGGQNTAVPGMGPASK